MADKVEIFIDVAGEHRWRRIAANGEELSGSGEGYKNKQWAVTSAHKLNKDVPDENFSDLTNG